MTHTSATDNRVLETVACQPQSATVPNRVAVHRSVPGERSIIHYQEQEVNGVPVISALEVEAVNRRLPGHSRKFDLSHLCEQGSQWPESMRQIVDPDLSEETRLDALKTLVESMCRVPLASIRGVDIVPTSEVARTRRTREKQESPLCSIEPSLKTTLAQLVRGTQRCCFTVSREKQSIVDFLVQETGGTVDVAVIRMLSVHLDLPLLDRYGSLVTSRTLNNAIDDFYSILRSTEKLPLRQSLELVAKELDRRLDRAKSGGLPREGQESLESIQSFSRELQMALENFPMDIGEGRRSPVIAASPFEVDKDARWQSRIIEEDRHIWIGLGTDASRAGRDRLHIAGCTGQTIPYKISVDCSSWFRLALGRVQGQVVTADAPKKLFSALHKLVQIPSLAVRYEVSKEPHLYPDRINSLVESIQSRFGTAAMGHGMLFDYDSRQIFPAVELMQGLIHGRDMVPVWGVVSTDNVAFRWSFQGFVDENMRGTLVVRNPLGAFSLLRDVENSLWRAFERAGDFAGGRFDRIAPWAVGPLPGGRWALSVTSRGLDGRGDVPVYSFEMSRAGVDAFMVSVGDRSFLGHLEGTLVSPGGASVFDNRQLNGILKFLRAPLPSADMTLIDQMLQQHVPTAVRYPAISMSMYDPRLEERDVLRRTFNWFRQIFS